MGLAEYFSRMIGNKTYVDIQRNGEQVSLIKNFMEKAEQKPLLYPNELLELLPGECVIRRAMKRFDLKGNKSVQDRFLMQKRQAWH